MRDHKQAARAAAGGLTSTSAPVWLARQSPAPLAEPLSEPEPSGAGVGVQCRVAAPVHLKRD